jgi:hypothetical protein
VLRAEPELAGYCCIVHDQVQPENFIGESFAISASVARLRGANFTRTTASGITDTIEKSYRLSGPLPAIWCVPRQEPWLFMPDSPGTGKRSPHRNNLPVPCPASRGNPEPVRRSIRLFLTSRRPGR